MPPLDATKPPLPPNRPPVPLPLELAPPNRPPLDGDITELPPKRPPLEGNGVELSLLTAVVSVLDPNGLANDHPPFLDSTALPPNGLLLETIKLPPKMLPLEGDSPELRPKGPPSRSEVRSLNGVLLAGDMLPLCLSRSSQS